MKKLIVFIAIFSLCIVSVVFAGGEGEKEYVFATNATWPPMEFIDENKELVGFDIDLVNAIAREANFKATFLSTSWDGIFIGLQNGEYDAIASSVTITEERKKSMGFSDSYFNAGQLLAVRKEDASSIKSPADLLGKIVGVQIGTSGAFYIEENFPNVILKTYDDLGPAVIELAQGTIDGIVADVPLVVDYLLKNPKYTDTFAAVGTPMTQEEYGFVVQKENDTFRDLINTGLQKVKSSGEYDEIYAKWIK